MNFDVAIVGYGPAGATAAALLGRSGLNVAVVDKATAIFDKPRALTADHEVMRVMQFAGIGKEFGEHAFPDAGTQFLGADGGIIREIHGSPPPYPLGWPTAVHFVQPEFERMLRQAVSRQANVTTFLDHEVVNVEDFGESVSVDVVNNVNSTYLSIKAKYVLGCDGAGSFVRKRLAIGFEDLQFDEPWVVVDAFVKAGTVMPKMNTHYCNPLRPGSLVIGPGTFRRWEIKILPTEAPQDFNDNRVLGNAIQSFVDPDAIDIWRVAVYRFHAVVALKWRVGRVFLAGDAAHQTAPFLAQGMCAGIRDVANISWKLVSVLRGQASPKLLETYEEERKDHARVVISLSKQRGLLIGELDPVAASKRDALMRTENASGQAETKRHRLIPPLTRGTLAVDEWGSLSPGAGSLFPQPHVSNETSDGLLDDFLPRAFLLVSNTAAALNWLEPAQLRQFKKIGGVRVVLSVQSTAERLSDVVAFQERDGIFHDWCQDASAVAVIVRPDRYVYGTARKPNELKLLFEGLLEKMGATSLITTQPE